MGLRSRHPGKGRLRKSRLFTDERPATDVTLFKTHPDGRPATEVSHQIVTQYGAPGTNLSLVYPQPGKAKFVKKKKATILKDLRDKTK